jgi:uncharacterized protein (TIGR03437 family)
MKHLVGVLFCCALPLAAQYRIATVAGADHLREGSPATAAMFRNPRAMTVDPQGNIYVADTEDNRIRRISPTGTITTVAGNGASGFSGDGGRAVNASLNSPEGLAVDRNNVLYIADTGNNRVRAVELSGGTIRTVAGNGNSQYIEDNLLGPDVQLTPVALALDNDGDLYVADRQAPVAPARLFWQIRKVNVTSGRTTSVGGPLTQFNPLTGMYGLAVDSQNTIYIAAGPDLLRLLPNNLNYQRVAGGGANQQIVSVALDRNGVVHYGDYLDPRVVRINPDTQIYETVAGNSARSGFAGDGQRAFGNSLISRAISMAFDARGNLLFIDGGSIGDSRLAAAVGNRRLRRIDAGTGIINTIAGSVDDPAENRAHVVRLNSPRGLAIDRDGNLIIADSRNDAVRRLTVNPASPLNGTVATIADANTPPFQADPQGVGIFEPTVVTIDPLGNVVVGEGPNRHRVKRIVGNSVITIAGGDLGCCANGVPATQAGLRWPNGLFYDPRGNLFIADKGRAQLGAGSLYRVNTNLFFDTIYTTARSELPEMASVIDPYDIAMDPSGNLIVAGGSFHRVLRVTLDGVVTTIAGTGVAGFTGDDGQRATAARLNFPTSIAYDSRGNLFIADSGNGVIRRIDQFGFISTVAGTGRQTGGAYMELARATDVRIQPVRLAIDRNDNIYFTDQLDSRVKMLFNNVNVPLSSSVVITAGVPRIVARVTTASGLPVQGVTVDFAIVSGDGTLSVARTVTGVDGTASSEVRFGPNRDVVRVSATVAGSQPVIATVSPSTLSPEAPVISSISGAPQSNPPVQAVSTGAAIVIGGTNLSSGVRGLLPQDYALGTLPTNLGGTCVKIGDRSAFLYSVSPTRLSVQVPAVPATGTVQVEVLTNCGTNNELSSGQREVTSRGVTPEMYYYFGDNVAAVNAQGESVGPPVAFFGTRFTPARPGESITIYGTGWGTTDPIVAPGVIPAIENTVVAPVRVVLNGRSITALRSSLVLGTAGLYQTTFRIPDDAAEGDLPVTIDVFGVFTPQGTLRVAR